MKTIGIIGGMSWESTVTYYQMINQTIQRTLGGYHSAKILIYSVDFAEIEKYLSANNWEKNAEIMTDAALRLERGGADCVLIGTNTLHKVADNIKKSITIPLIHIAEVTADALQKDGIKTTALLGTRFTMEQEFFKDKLTEHGIEVITPDENDRKFIDHVIFNELCLGIISNESKKSFIEIINKLSAQGAQAAILGCTEIGLLVSKDDTSVPLYDTTEIHAKSAVAFALSEFQQILIQ